MRSEGYLGEVDHQFLVAEPRHGDGLVGQPGSDQERFVGALIQGDVDTGFVDGNGRGDIEEIAEEFLGLSPLIFAPDLGGQEPIERTGHEGNLEVEINFEPVSLDRMPRVAHTVVNDDSAGLIRCSVPVRL